MRKRTLERLLKRFQDLRQLVDQTIQDIEGVLQDETEWSSGRERSKKTATIAVVDEESLRQEWQHLREKIRNSSDPQSSIHDFVQSKSKSELGAFLRANALPIDPKTSKEEIIRQLVQLLKVAQAITGDSSRQVEA